MWGFVVGWLGVGLCGWALCLGVCGVGLGISFVCISLKLFFQRSFFGFLFLVFSLIKNLTLNTQH